MFLNNGYASVGRSNSCICSYYLSFKGNIRIDGYWFKRYIIL